MSKQCIHFLYTLGCLYKVEACNCLGFAMLLSATWLVKETHIDLIFNVLHLTKRISVTLQNRCKFPLNCIRFVHVPQTATCKGILNYRKIHPMEII